MSHTLSQRSPNQPSLIQKGRSIFHTSSILLLALTLCLFLFSNKALAQSEPDHASEQNENIGQFIGAKETIYPDWFKTSFLELEEDVAEAADAGKRLMMVFHQDNCPYCNAFVERNLSQKDIEETLKEKFDVIELNMWGDREVASVSGEVYTEKQFAEALRVQFTPTVLFLDEAGSLALRINGYQDPDRFRLVLDYVSNKLEKKHTFEEYIREQSVEESSKDLPQRSYITGPITELGSRPGVGKKPLLLLFEQGSCKNCETLHDKILAKDDSQSLLNEFDIYQIDIWGRDTFTTPDGEQVSGREWSQQLGISYAPTLILYAADGTEVIRSEAWFKTFHTQSIMDYVVTGSWKTQPSFQRYLSARAEEIREGGEDVNIWD